MIIAATLACRSHTQEASSAAVASAKGWLPHDTRKSLALGKSVSCLPRQRSPHHVCCICFMHTSGASASCSRVSNASNKSGSGNELFQDTPSAASRELRRCVSMLWWDRSCA